MTYPLSYFSHLVLVELLYHPQILCWGILHMFLCSWNQYDLYYIAFRLDRQIHKQLLALY